MLFAETHTNIIITLWNVENNLLECEEICYYFPCEAKVSHTTFRLPVACSSVHYFAL